MIGLRANGPLGFREDLVRLIEDHRIGVLTPVFQAFSFLGTVEGYVLVITFVFAVRNTALAHRLTVLVLVAMSLNHVSKTVLRNPRPFIGDGHHLDHWAVWGEDTGDLAAEFSTPSGHAMAAAAFYGFLLGRARTTRARVLCVAAIAATGLSRPYLGVHYVEDIALGWVLGGALAYLAVRHEPAITAAWRRLGRPRQVGAVVAGGVGVWLFTEALSGRGPAQPLAYVAYAGLLLGAVIGFPLESRLVGLDPTSGSGLQRAGRWVLTAALVLASLVALDALSELVATERSVAGQVLRYLRYALVALTATVGASALLVRLRLAGRIVEDPRHHRS